MQKDNRRSLVNMFQNLFSSYADKDKAKEELQSIHNDNVKVSDELKTLIKNNPSLQTLIIALEDYKSDVADGYKKKQYNADYLAGVDSVLTLMKNIISYNEITDINDVIDFGDGDNQTEENENYINSLQDNIEDNIEQGD